MNQIIGIAIDEYENHNSLDNCANDINCLVEIMCEKYKFTPEDTVLLINKSETARSYLVKRLQELFANSLEEDNILLLYAGHGEYNPELDTSYIIPSDGSIDDASTWINCNDISQFIKNARAKHISVIFDSCFSGGIIKGIHRGGGFEALSKGKSRLALASGSIEKVSDGVNEHSPFAQTLCEVLNDNEDDKITFRSLSEKVILNFSKAYRQTPAFGQFKDSGHESGCFIFELQEHYNKDYTIKDYSIDIGLAMNIDYSCKIPSFKNSNYFDTTSINAQIHSIAFKVISETRKLIQEGYIDTERMPLNLEIDYDITYINSNYLSLIITVYSDMGGLHPNYYEYSLNLSLRPEVLLSFNDIIFYDGTLCNELKRLVMKYGEKGTRKVMSPYLEDIEENELEFTFDDSNLFLHLTNHLPRYLWANGSIKVPLNSVKHNIKMIK